MPFAGTKTAVLYDADCNICKAITETLLTWDRAGHLRPVAIQSEEGNRLLHAVPPEDRLKSFHLVSPDGGVESAGPALADLFRHLPGGSAVARVLELSPETTRRGYEWIAANRVRLSRPIPQPLKRLANRRLAARLEDP